MSKGHRTKLNQKTDVPRVVHITAHVLWCDLQQRVINNVTYPQ